MSEPGYIYVLANSSMPDLVKVGKTARTPSARAQELSGVTGVPTPFIVVYELYVGDTGAAEEFVHSFLERKGYRVSSNREFFSAPVKEVIAAILAIPDQILESLAAEDDSDSADEFSEIDDVPWADLWSHAENVRLGMAGEIQDEAEAASIYEDALALGCPHAYYRLGRAYEYGSGVNKSERKALEYYKEGAKKGHYLCFLGMSSIYGQQAHEQPQVHFHKENMMKCISKFMRDRIDNRSEQIEDFFSFELEMGLPILVLAYFDDFKKLGRSDLDLLKIFKEEIVTHTRADIELAKSNAKLARRALDSYETQEIQEQLAMLSWIASI